LSLTCQLISVFRIGTEHEKFGFDVETLRPITYDQISGILNGLSERFEWDKIMEEGHVIGLKQVYYLKYPCYSLDPLLIM
jgi:glutamate--cysteine ligase